MCGFIITNILGDIENPTKILEHRGPDDKGIFQDSSIKIIFNRLSILDLHRRSNQPFIYKNLILVFNGEIYNYIELKRELKKLGYKFNTNSDTEVLMYAYLKWGRKCLDKLEGMFSFCVYDKRKRNLFVARDRFGIKPLFYYKKEEKFIIASEKKAIFALGIKKKINKFSLVNYIQNGVYQNDENTFYENVFSLNPGHYILVKNNKFQFYKWFELSFNINHNLKYNDAKEELNHLFKKAIKFCIRSDKDIVVATSGGIDSAQMIFKLREQKLTEKIKYYLHWTCADLHDEQEYARTSVLESGQKNLDKIFLLSLFSKRDFYKYLYKCMLCIEEPFGGLPILSCSKSFQIMKERKLRVLIDGNGMDEILGGYQHHINAYYNNSLNYNIQPVQGLNFNFPKNILKKKYSKIKHRFKIEKRFNDPLKDSMYNDLTGSKLRRCLLQQDHNTMMYSIESRFPWLNNELVNFCYTLPNHFLVNNYFGKFIMRDTTSTKFFWSSKRPHQGPQTKWIKEFILNDLIKDLKSDKEFFDLGIFEKNNLIKELLAWKIKTNDNSIFPWYLLMSYLFIKMHIMGDYHQRKYE